MTSCLLLGGVLLAAAPKFEVYRVADDPNGGIVPIEAALNEWRTPVMDMRDFRPKPENEVISGPDFFAAEFGEPLAFAFTNGFSRLWGNRGKGDLRTPAIRLGRGWGGQIGRTYQLRMDIEQNVGTSRWEFAAWENGSRHPCGFAVVVPKGGRRELRVPLGVVRGLQQMTAVELTCLTTNACGRVHSAALVPVAVPVVWRGRFDLGFDPWRAGVTVPRQARFTLRVNGREVEKGLGLGGIDFARIDLSDVLHRGTNVIEYAADYTGHPGQFTIEAFAVDRTGRTERMKLDSWRVRFEEGDASWRVPFWSRTPGNVAGFVRLANGKKVASGFQPLHAGPIRVRHLGPKYPVYDLEEKVAWRVELPPELGPATLACVVSNQTERKVADVRTWTTPLAASDLVLPGLSAGAYKLFWELRRGTNALDRCRTQMIVAGPVEQTFCAFNDFDRVLAGRMKLTQEVDCTKDDSDPRRYAENACRPNWPNVDHGTHVRQENGISFREAGASGGDWFGYRLEIANLGRAHVLEVDYPDTRRQLLYVAVEESYPIGFRNNLPNSGTGFPNASGAVRTGWQTPLTNGKRTLRLVFYPGSRNAAVYFENGGLGGRAAVCGFRLHEVPEGLPALKLPETDRLFGNHCERPLCGSWGASECGLAPVTWTAGYENACAAAYAGIANRIRFLRYMGQNLAVEGVYMYKAGLATLSGESETTADDFDYPYVMAKMYRRNGIRAFAGFEYLASPAIGLGGGYDLGDREMRAATRPLTPSHTVSRYGRQVVGFSGMGLNYLAPHVWTSITNLVTEVYDRYAGTGGFEGLFVVNNGWWIPGFPYVSGDRLVSTDVGYDDLSVELFQRETGIDLGVPYTPERFERRYEKIMRACPKAWLDWRARKLRESMEAIQAICSRGTAKWTVYCSPCARLNSTTNPYHDRYSTAGARDACFPNLMREAGFPGELWDAGSDAKTRFVPTIGQALAGSEPDRGLICNAGTRALLAKEDAVYLSGVGLNERWISTDRLPGWWFRAVGSTVYDVRPSGSAAFADLVDVCSGRTPQLMLRTWLDVNAPTAHGRESRRFAVGFAATPKGEAKPFPAIRGVQAEIFPNGAVRLVNATPYALRGSLRCRRLGFACAVTDAFAGEREGDFTLTLEPYGMTVLTTANAPKTLSGQFRFADEEPVAAARTQAAAILGNRILCARIRREALEPLARAVREQDDYGIVAGLRDYEVQRVAGLWLEYALTADARPADKLRVVSRWEGSRPRQFRKGVPHQGFGAIDGHVKSASGRRTVSLLVRTKTGRDCALLLGDDPFRYDFHVREGKFRVSTLAFRKKPGQKGWLEVGMGADESLSIGDWHHVCWTVDPEKSCSLWVDGELVAAKPLVDHRGLPCTFVGNLGASRPEGRADADGNVDLEIARFVMREGVMSWEDVQRESEDFKPSRTTPRWGSRQGDRRSAIMHENE